MPDVGGIAADRLKSFVARIEHLEEEVKALNGDKSDVYKEAKAEGFDIKILREIIRLRRMDSDELDEREMLLDLYKRAVGMLPDFEPVAIQVGTPVATRARTKSISDAERRGADDEARGIPVSSPPSGFSADELAAWDRGWVEAAKGRREAAE